MEASYVHGYDLKEALRLQDQAASLVDLLHSDTAYPAGSTVLEVGCGVGAQTVTLAANSPGARFTSIDISEESLAQARAAHFSSVHASPRMVYADASRPELVEGFTRKTFTAMVEGVRQPAIDARLATAADFDAGIAALYRTAQPGGVFCYTFFKATATANALGKS